MMLRSSDEGVQAVAAPVRITALDRARTFITLLVVLHHSVVNYTHFGNGDRMRWLGFDLVVLFNDSFFMAFMFLISGLFVHDSLTRRGVAEFLRWRAWRLMSVGDVPGSKFATFSSDTLPSRDEGTARAAMAACVVRSCARARRCTSYCSPPSL